MASARPLWGPWAISHMNETWLVARQQNLGPSWPRSQEPCLPSLFPPSHPVAHAFPEQTSKGSPCSVYPQTPGLAAPRTQENSFLESGVTVPLAVPLLSQQVQNSPSCQQASISAELGAGPARPPHRPQERAPREGGRGCFRRPQPPTLAAPSCKKAWLRSPRGQRLEARPPTPKQHSLAACLSPSVPQSHDLHLSSPHGCTGGPFHSPTNLPPHLSTEGLGSTQAGGSDSGVGTPGSHPLHSPGVTALAQQPSLQLVLGLDRDKRTWTLSARGDWTRPHCWPAQPNTKIALCHCSGFGFTPGRQRAETEVVWGWGGKSLIFHQWCGWNRVPSCWAPHCSDQDPGVQGRKEPRDRDQQRGPGPPPRGTQG